MSSFEEKLESIIAECIDTTPRAEMIAALRRTADVLEADEDEEPVEYKGE